MDINSQDYLAHQYQQMHAGENRYRGKVIPYLGSVVADCVKRHEAIRLLDYGCGKGEQYFEHRAHDAWGGWLPYLYDFGVEEFSNKPLSTFDGVLCFDVAEHIPERGVPSFLKDVLSYANRFAVFCIFTEPAKAALPDGRNAHLTVRPQEWWEREIIDQFGRGIYTSTSIKPWHIRYDYRNRGIEVHAIFRCRANKNLDQ